MGRTTRSGSGSQQYLKTWLGFKAIWLASSSGKFDCAATWEKIRSKKEAVPCWKLISDAIPRLSFIGWMVSFEG
uniref:Reverse transcriptase zinc-binding domain-containing protein n=1 Tax=Fagus sylvatica TaxID=28930 RepID=A0A2N9HDH4_FAGSY